MGTNNKYLVITKGCSIIRKLIKTTFCICEKIVGLAQ